jgi:hypothetical protein
MVNHYILRSSGLAISEVLRAEDILRKERNWRYKAEDERRSAGDICFEVANRKLKMKLPYWIYTPKYPDVEFA